MNEQDRISISDYFEESVFLRIKKAADTKQTPFLIVDTETIKHQYDELANNFPYASVYYAVKANPDPEIISLLRDKGSSFDLASVYELDRVLALGIEPGRLSFGNTIKKNKDVRNFFEKGVRLFATDSEADLRNLSKAAPGSRIYVRILTEGTLTADWHLSRKFGCEPDMAIDLLILARDLGLVPYGISFHVGSQQREIAAWDAALGKVSSMMEQLRAEHGIAVEMINMGGGLPANYLSRTNSLATYAGEIRRYLEKYFGENLPSVLIEPGRSIVGNAGIIVSEVVLISRKSRTALHRWVFTDVGKFSGLIETLGESIKYPIYTDRNGEVEEVILAGPTCDSADTMYEEYKYPLPLNLSPGDRLYWLSTGAYTRSYSAIEFNGFPPLAAMYI